MAKKPVNPKPRATKLPGKTVPLPSKPMTPAQRQGAAKRPAVGNDKAVAKKVKGPSHNNGYTN